LTFNYFCGSILLVNEKIDTRSGNQVIDDLATAIESPADSYQKYKKASAAAAAATKTYAALSSTYYGPRSSEEFRRLRSTYESRPLVGRLLHADEKRAIAAKSAELHTLQAELAVAGNQKNDAQLNLVHVDYAGAKHYHEHEAAYHQEALDDAADAGVEIHLPASPSSEASEQPLKPE
jgi:hypothetical protein